MFNSILFKRTLIWLAIFHFIFMLFYSLPVRLNRTDQNRDLIAYFLVLERIKHNLPVYSILPKAGPHSPEFPVYQYPPFLSSILATLPAMSFMAFSRFWTLLLYVAFWIYATCLAKLAVRRVTIAGVLVAGLALTLFPGTHMALSLGQVDPFLWALFGIALTVPQLRGGCLMAVTLIKPWALWPLLWAIGRERKVLIGASAVTIGSILLGVATRGAGVYSAELHTWFYDVLPTLGQGSWSAWNWSVSFGAVRLVRASGLWDYSGGVLPVWARLWLLVCSVAVPFLAGFVFRRRSLLLQLSAVGCSAVVFAPLCWVTYLPIILTLLALMARQQFLRQEAVVTTAQEGQIQ